MTKDSESDSGAVTQVRADIPEETSASAPTNIRSNYTDNDEDGDKTVVVGVGLSSSNDATVIIGSGEAAATGSPTLTLGNTKVINDRFELLDVLGSGGMGVVFKALDRRKVEAQDRDPYVAIKLLNDDFKVHPHSVISLQREARRSQQLAHPNIVNVHDFDRDGDQVFMTMEYLQGRPLDELIKDNGKQSLPDADAHRILKDMCAGMIHAHKNNIAHSDFKPGNIFVTNAGQAKVLDFGIARAVTTGVVEEGGHSENTLFDPGSLGALTPAYASREMLIGQLPEVGDDVYAVGCVAYELFTGKHPFDKKNAVDAKKEGLKPVRIKSLSARQWKALRKALAFKREDRYPSVKEFWEDFDRHVSPVWLVAGVVLLIVAASAIWSVEQRSRLDGVDEDAIRLQADQDFSYRNLQAWIKRQPLSNVEKELRGAYEKYQKLVPETDEQLLAAQQQIVALYLSEADALREQKQFDGAKARLAAAASWQADVEQGEQYQLLMTAINQDVETERLRVAKEEAARLEKERLAKEAAAKVERERLAAIEREKMAAAAKEREINYQAALAKVEVTLSCQKVPDFKVLKQQLEALSGLDAARAREKSPEFSESLALCVKRVANSNPVAGGVAQTEALKIFPESALLQSLVIDPCASNKLGPGSGRRSSKFCVDRFANVAGPKMVIVEGVSGGKPYAISKYEITAKEFGVYCQSGGDCVGVSDQSSGLPARQLSIAQAKAYAQWLSNNTGFTYRLPTYAEWYSAAKANGRDKNLDPNCTVKRVNGTLAGDELRVAGGGYNDWGLYNVVGNVQEWAMDGSSIVAAGGKHTDRLADSACSVEHKEAHSGAADAVTGFRLMREIKR